MPAVSTVSLRRLLSQRGLTPATWIPEASQGRAEEATIKPARLVEGEVMAAHSVGEAEPWPNSVAFLDGIQRYEIVGYLDTAPLVVARVAAAVRERPGPGSRPRLAVSLERRLAIGRPEVLERVADMLGDTRLMPLGDEVAGHPVREVQAARKVVDRERGAAELEVGRQFRAESYLGLEPSTAARSSGHRRSAVGGYRLGGGPTDGRSRQEPQHAAVRRLRPGRLPQDAVRAPVVGVRARD